MPDREKVINGLKLCAVAKCGYKCPYEDIDACRKQLLLDAAELLKEQERESGRLPVEPTRGNDDNYYCGKCGAKITNAIKIYDGERFLTSHPDHLKPVNKWQYCKCCGQAVKWDG